MILEAEKREQEDLRLGVQKVEHSREMRVFSVTKMGEKRRHSVMTSKGVTKMMDSNSS